MEDFKNTEKIIPCYINSDKELDAIYLDESFKLTWINNIRGTSKEIKNEIISKNTKVVDFLVSDTINYYQYGVSIKYIFGINTVIRLINNIEKRSNY
jgi:hypothetical protein